MLGKSLVAGTVLTLLAGGVVYYGTDAEGNISAQSGMQKLESLVKKADGSTESASKVAVETASDSSKASFKVDHPHEEHKEEASKGSSDIPAINGELIDPKAASVSANGASINIETSKSQDKISEDKTAIDKSVEIETEGIIKATETDVSSETPTRKWIDQYLKSEAKTPELKSDNNQEEVEAAAEILAQNSEEVELTEDPALDDAKMQAEIDEVLAQEEALEKELAQMMAEMEETETLEHVEVEVEVETPETEEVAEVKLFTDEEILEAEAKGFEDRAKDIENIWVSKDDVTDIDDKSATTTTETDTIDLGDGTVMKIIKVKRVDGELKHEVVDTEEGKRIKIRKAKTPHIHAGHSRKEHDKNCVKDEESSAKVDVSETAKIVMTQAKKISMSELRDRAYLDLVSYALDNGDNAVANKAMSKIEQVELRDTARNRMAVSYAKAGNASKAFAILEDIEVDALRDVMRLQVIEALIVPEATAPKDMQ